MTHRHLLGAAALAAAVAACAPAAPSVETGTPAPQPAPASPAPAATVTAVGDPDALLAKYTPVRLTTQLPLSANERRMIPLLIDAAREMDAVFKMQAYGNVDSLMAATSDPELRRFIAINYGPWDRLGGNAPFVAGVGAKPEGANFYPAGMTKAEFEAEVARGGARADSLKSLYTLVRRDPAGRLYAVPYHVAYAEHHRRAADKIRQAAALAEDPGLRRYLELRADALLTDEYQASDLAWLDMKNNTLDLIVGPIETYEDQMFGYKAAHSTYVLVKDQEWTRRLARLAALLPGLQRDLPVPAQLKQESPGSDSDLGAYDVIYYAGDSNAGSKTIAVNLPNDEQVQLQKGTRRLQLQNAMRAKFDRIMVPIAGVLIVPEQRELVQFDAFFENTMFHEVAHGLGIKNTVNGRGTVRESLKERASALEEGKADVLGLWMVTQLANRGELSEAELRDNYTTFLAGIFRSVRFGASSAHGRANIARFNYFKEAGAFTRTPQGQYRVDFDRMRSAMNTLSAQILRYQGEGDYAGVGTFMERYGNVDPQLQADLDRLGTAGIPVDVVFEQGTQVLGL